MVLILICPPFPLSDVDADMVVFSAIVRFLLSILIIPASPLPVVSTEIKPSPKMLMFSGANILILPPSPVEEVRAEIKPCSVKVMLRLGANSLFPSWEGLGAVSYTHLTLPTTSRV